jgi:hypothetical protein
MFHRIKRLVSFAFILALLIGILFISEKPLSHLTTLAHTETADITTGLVGWWKFDEGTGTTAADSSGNGRTGTLMNGPTWTAGKIGGAANLDGVDDRVDIAGDPLGTGAMTFSVWIYARSTSNVPAIVSSGAFPDTQLFVQPLLNNALGFTHDGGASAALSNAIHLNTWQHIVVVRDASNQITFYVDGVQSGTANQAIGKPTEGSTVNSIGDRYVGGAHAFNGMITDVRIYNRALTATDIQALYNLSNAQ